MSHWWCCCTNTNSCQCCDSATNTCSIDWDTTLTAVANCGTGLPAGTYVADWVPFNAPFGACGCYWRFQYNDSTVYSLCVGGSIYGTDPNPVFSGFGFTVALVHDLINSTCYLACSFELLVTSAAGGGGNTVNILACGLYVSDPDDTANVFCSGTFDLALASTDPDYKDCNGNNLWDEPNVGNPFTMSTFAPYTGGITGALPTSITITF